LAQTLIISECGLGLRLDTTIGIFLLWTAAVVLSIKYSMVAQKVASAINEHNVVNRDNYRKIVWFFVVLYLLSLCFFLFIMIANIVVPDSDKKFED
jgi:hypothetical protein